MPSDRSHATLALDFSGATFVQRKLYAVDALYLRWKAYRVWGTLQIVSALAAVPTAVSVVIVSSSALQVVAARVLAT
jgi:hypothetical protein